jgi:hypothetical protein
MGGDGPTAVATMDAKVPDRLRPAYDRFCPRGFACLSGYIQHLIP